MASNQSGLKYTFLSWVSLHQIQREIHENSIFPPPLLGTSFMFHHPAFITEDLHCVCLPRSVLGFSFSWQSGPMIPRKARLLNMKGSAVLLIDFTRFKKEEMLLKTFPIIYPSEMKLGFSISSASRRLAATASFIVAGGILPHTVCVLRGFPTERPIKVHDGSHLLSSLCNSHN